MRLDQYIVQQKLAPSREKAKFLIKSGAVTVNSKVYEKPSTKIKETDLVSVNSEFAYVGRGGYKIKPAIEQFKIELADKIVADVGCSTGGFTHYALESGAKKVFAIDIGENLDQELKKHVKVIKMLGKDARLIEKLPEKVHIAVIDLTFVSQKDILPIVRKWLKPQGEILTLIKPPFETKDTTVNRNYELCKKVAEDVIAFAQKKKFEVLGFMDSPVIGKKRDQQEFFLYLRKQ